MWLGLSATRCLATVCLGTRSTQRPEWSPPACVCTHTHTLRHRVRNAGGCICSCCVTLGGWSCVVCVPAQKIHASSETYLALIKDNAYDLQLRGEIEVKVNRKWFSDDTFEMLQL